MESLFGVGGWKGATIAATAVALLIAVGWFAGPPEDNPQKGKRRVSILLYLLTFRTYHYLNKENLLLDQRHKDIFGLLLRANIALCLSQKIG
jgi:hypothetical protein